MFFQFCYNGEEESKKEDAFEAGVVKDSVVLAVVDGNATFSPLSLTSETSTTDNKTKVVGEFVCEDDMKMMGGVNGNDDDPELWIPLVDDMQKPIDEETNRDKTEGLESLPSNNDNATSVENKENNNNKKKKRRKKKSKWQKRGGIDERTPVLSPGKLDLIREKQQQEAASA